MMVQWMVYIVAACWIEATDLLVSTTVEWWALMVVKLVKKQESCWADMWAAIAVVCWIVVKVAKWVPLTVFREAAWWVAKMVQHWADM